MLSIEKHNSNFLFLDCLFTAPSLPKISVKALAFKSELKEK